MRLKTEQQDMVAKYEAENARYEAEIQALKEAVAQLMTERKEK